MIDFIDYPNSKYPASNILDQFFMTKNEDWYNNLLDIQGLTYYIEHSGLGHFAYELPRLKPDSVVVSIEPAFSPKQYDLIIEGERYYLHSYTQEAQETPKTKTYKEKLRLCPKSEFDLNSDLKLSYTGGVLVVAIPLTKPVQPKKQGLSARLSDIES